MDRVPILFDTDIGSDIDDAVALAYLLREPRCELLGITTVSGEPQERAKLASAVCRAAGRGEVPIHSGVERPLLIDQRQPLVPQAAVLPRWPHREEFPAYTAVSFLRETIRSRPGEITLLAVGPFTNVAALLASDPETGTLLKRIVIMGGVYLPTSGRTEWNATCDPHATAILFSSLLNDLTAYGLDVTLQCKLPAEECRRRLRGGVLDVVADMAEVWFANTTKSGHARPRETICFHDPLAAVGIFHPEVCTYRRGWVTVETASESLGGMTTFNGAPSAPREIAVDVDVERFFELYFRVFE